MVLLDTSYLIAFFNKDDIHHFDALELAKSISGRQAFIPMVIFSELMGVLNRKNETHFAHKIGRFIMSADSPIQIFKIDDSAFDDAWVHFRSREQHALSFVDCMLIALSKNMDAELLTFDKELALELK